MSPQMQAVQKGWVECTIDSSSPNEFHRDTSLRRSIGKRCLQFYMPFCFGMKSGEEGKSVLPAIIRVLLMGLINTPSRVWQLSLFSGYSSSLWLMISKFSHSGSHLKRISWWMQHLVMITKGLLILVCRYLTISLGHHNCARSCIPSSQLPRSEHSAKIR